jgi:uncharacterized protein (UPF0210 family)
MIRSLTIGLPLDEMATAEIDSRVRLLLRVAHATLSHTPDSPRTVRYTLPPVGAEGESEGAMLSRLRWVDDLAGATEVRWYCLPLDFVTAGPRRGRIAAALDGILRFEKMFLNVIIADNRQIAVNAVHDAARLVLDISRKSNNGFDNFRVGASFNCPANAPFFPFSRHAGAGVAFTFALETTELALGAISRCAEPRDIDAVRDQLAAELARVARSLDTLGREIALESGAEYRGLDASFAPLPAERVSVAALVERLMGTPVGSHGRLFATALLTDALRAGLAASGARAVGFNGVMYSVLEDTVLAAANSQRQIDIDALLSLATVCACGLDMIPVPGISFPEEIAAVMLDVAAISCALDKPLGVRLLPIPGGCVNEFTRFNLDFLCDSRVIGLTANDRRLETREHLVGLRSPRR